MGSEEEISIGGKFSWWRYVASQGPSFFLLSLILWWIASNVPAMMDKYEKARQDERKEDNDRRERINAAHALTSEKYILDMASQRREFLAELKEMRKEHDGQIKQIVGAITDNTRVANELMQEVKRQGRYGGKDDAKLLEPRIPATKGDHQ